MRAGSRLGQPPGTGVRQLLGSTNCSPVAPPAREWQKDDTSGGVPLKGDDVRIVRPAFGSMAYYAQDREDMQFEVNRLA